MNGTIAQTVSGCKVLLTKDAKSSEVDDTVWVASRYAKRSKMKWSKFLTVIFEP